MTAKSISELVERLRKYSDPVHVEEFYMKRWDKIHGYIAAGHKGSWPRDVFESLIDGWAQDAMEAASALESQAAEIARLREALKPFSAKVAFLDNEPSSSRLKKLIEDEETVVEVSLKSCISARAALGETTTGGNDGSILGS